jgi:twitching motility protein PilI
MSKLDLRSFQKELSERLAAVRRSGGEAPRLTFTVADVSYALPLSEVTEVAPLGTVRNVPGSQPWFLGLTNVRGAVVGLSHLGALLHGASVRTSNASRVLVLGGAYSKLRAAFLVDSVTGLRTIAATKAATHGYPWAAEAGTDQNGEDWNLLQIAPVLQSTSFLSVTDLVH